MLKQSLTSLFLLSTALYAQAIGVVDFKACIENSKLGKSEQNAFNSLKDQMTTIVEKTNKELEEIAKKLEDNDYMDSLSNDAQKELQQRFQALSQEMARYQTQYYQILNQAQIRLLQELQAKVGESTEVVAKAKQLTLVLNEEACFYFEPKLEITKDVISEMDVRFDKEASTNQEGQDNKGK